MMQSLSNTAIIQNTNSWAARSAPFMLFLAATGTSYAIQKINDWQPYLKSRIPIVIDLGGNLNEASAETLIGSYSLVQKLDLITTTFHYGVSDLARIFGLSRQAIYKWKKEQVTPEAPVSAKLDNLARLALLFSQEDIKRAGELVKLKYFGDQALLDMVVAGGASDTYLGQVMTYIKSTQSNAGRVGHSQPSGESEWLSSQSLSYRGTA